MLRAGDKVGPYTLIKKLGMGGFGVVWLAEKRTIFATHKVALKIALEDKINLEAIKREASLWEQANNHSNVLPIFDADVYDGQIVVIASQYAPDGSLEDWLNKYGGKAPSIEAAVEMASGILAGLEHLHSLNIIHRDLKPANILLQGETPCLADFGLARLLKPDSHSKDRSGTFPYMAPEAFDGERSEQTDIWSVGVVFYQILAGRLPFPQKDIVSLIGAITRYDPDPLHSSIPESLQKTIAQSLQKNPTHRYKSAAEMRVAVREAWRTLTLSSDDHQPPLTVISPVGKPQGEETVGIEPIVITPPPTVVIPSPTEDSPSPPQPNPTPTSAPSTQPVSLASSSSAQLWKGGGVHGFAEKDLAAFIGNNYLYYLKKWEKDLVTSRPSFNWAAFFGTGIWMAYRKMYLYACLFLFCIFLTSVLGYLSRMPDEMSKFVGVCTWILIGMFGNTIYWLHVSRKLRHIKSQGMDHDKEEALIKETGGTSIIGAIAFICWYFFIMVLLYFIDAQLYNPSSSYY